MWAPIAHSHGIQHLLLPHNPANVGPTVHIPAALLFLAPYLRLEAPLYSFAYFKNFHKSLSLAGSCYFPAGVFACALANHLAVK